MTSNTHCPQSREVSPEPGALIAALPYLVGFPPADSVVAAFLDSNESLVLTARLDWDAVTADLPQVSANLAQLAHQSNSTALVLIAIGPTSSPQTQEQELVELARCLDGSNSGRLVVRWAVHAQAGRWWSLDCHRNCGPRSHRVPAAAESPLACELEAEGWIPRKDRGQIIAEFEPAPRSDVEYVGRIVAELESADSKWLSCSSLRHSLVDRAELLLLADTVMVHEDLATIAVCCADSQMRDTLLWRFTRYSSIDRDVWRETYPRIHTVLAYAPDSHVAPVASVAGLFAWQKGDGIRAQAALDRANASDPEHRLARLIRTAVRAGLPPLTWRTVMSELSEDDVVQSHEPQGDDEDLHAA